MSGGSRSVVDRDKCWFCSPAGARIRATAGGLAVYVPTLADDEAVGEDGAPFAVAGWRGNGEDKDKGRSRFPLGMTAKGDEKQRGQRLLLRVMTA